MVLIVDRRLVKRPRISFTEFFEELGARIFEDRWNGKERLAGESKDKSLAEEGYRGGFVEDQILTASNERLLTLECRIDCELQFPEIAAEIEKYEARRAEIDARVEAKNIEGEDGDDDDDEDPPPKPTYPLKTGIYEIVGNRHTLRDLIQCIDVHSRAEHLSSRLLVLKRRSRNNPHPLEASETIFRRVPIYVNDPDPALAGIFDLGFLRSEELLRQFSTVRIHILPELAAVCWRFLAVTKPPLDETGLATRIRELLEAYCHHRRVSAPSETTLKNLVRVVLSQAQSNNTDGDVLRSDSTQ